MKNERFKIISFCFFCCLIFSCISFLITRISYNNYKNSVNSYIYNLIEILKKDYPDITDRELIKILNNDKKGNYNENLKKYGITYNDSILLKLDNDYHNSLKINISFIILVNIIFIILFFIYFSKKEKQINKITNYMKEINYKNYQLSIEDNGEGSLSILQNEVYKTTIMLREESENLKKEKIALKDSISDISHQLKTPLTSILIMLDNILDNPNMDDETKIDFINNVHHQVENINFLIVSLLKISRFDADVVEFKTDLIMVSKLLNEVLKNVEILKEINNVKIKINGKKNIYFKGDYHWELEALTNIIKNAIEHSRKNGIIHILIESNSIYTKIIIKDEGEGMSEKDLKNIFKRFYKGESSTNDSIGIGLSLAKKIIEKDNGLIKVDSKLNEGTTFEIRYMK